MDVNVPPPRTKDQQVLIIVGLMVNQVYFVLRSVPNWRTRFDIVSAYIFDAFLFESEINKPVWRRRFSRFTRTVASIDHLFIPMAESLEDWRQIYEIPVSMVPMACDVVRFGSGGTKRPIDLSSYGRQDPEVSRKLSEVYNDPNCSRMYYHTDHMKIGIVRDFFAHRRFFWKMLTRSRINLAFDAMAVNPDGRFTFSFVAQRWFEAIAAGCLVVGRRPNCPEADELLGWEDATVEIPDSEDELVPFIEALLSDNDRLEAAHHRNYANALARHDWRYRVADMIDHLKLPRPEPLQRELEQLRALCRETSWAVEAKSLTENHLA